MSKENITLTLTVSRDTLNELEQLCYDRHFDFCDAADQWNNRVDGCKGYNMYKAQRCSEISDELLDLAEKILEAITSIKK